MTRTMRNKYSMYTAVQSILDEHKEIWQDLAGFNFTVERCTALFDQLRILINSLAEKTRPTTARKHENLDRLTNESIELLGLLKSMAIERGENEMKEELTTSSSELKYGAIITRLQRFQRLAQLAERNLESMKELGWSAERHDSFIQSIGSSAAELSSPKLKRDQLSSRRDQIKSIMHQKDELLRSLDFIVYGFRSSHSQFTQLWEKARTVIDQGSRNRSSEITGGNNTPHDQSPDELRDDESSSFES